MDADAMIGSDLGRYRILAQLGEGGMAVVYQAYDPRLDRPVAVKVLKLYQVGQMGSTEARQAFLSRFGQEARALARLQHPHIVPVIDYGSADERYPYLVMPLLSGGTLADRAGEALAYTDAAQILAPIAEALAYAHRAGIIHRDIKPTNVLLSESGDPMLADFGIARFLEESLSLTTTGAFIGTPGYMAPEQWNGQVVPQTDLFSLGMVLYELVTGHNPYVADTPQHIMYRQLMEPLPHPRQYAPNLPGEVEQVLLTALAREPRDRYPNLDTFATILRHLAAGRIDTVLDYPAAGATALDGTPPAAAQVATADAGPAFVDSSPGWANVEAGEKSLVAPFPSERSIRPREHRLSGLAGVFAGFGSTLLLAVILIAFLYFTNHGSLPGVFANASFQKSAAVVPPGPISGLLPTTAVTAAEGAIAVTGPTDTAPVPTETPPAPTDTPVPTATPQPTWTPVPPTPTLAPTLTPPPPPTAAPQYNLVQPPQQSAPQQQPAQQQQPSGNTNIIILPPLTEGNQNPPPAAQPPAQPPPPTQPPAVSEGSQATVSIAANQSWQDTGLSVLPGQQVTITYLSGLWTYDKKKVPPFGANGKPKTDAAALIPSAPLGSLVGQIGGSPFSVGSGTSFLANQAGEIYLAMNDDADIQNNSGAVQVSIHVQ